MLLAWAATPAFGLNQSAFDARANNAAAVNYRPRLLLAHQQLARERLFKMISVWIFFFNQKQKTGERERKARLSSLPVIG